MKLTQKHLLKGTQEFEIVDDYVKFRHKAPFKEAETLTVMLTVLNPEPVITRSRLEFTSRVNGETLLSLHTGKPDTERFNAFVGELKQRSLEAFEAFAGLKSSNQSPPLGENAYEEPPAFDDDLDRDQPHAAKIRDDLDSARIEEALTMLKTHLDSAEVAPLVASLEALQHAPANREYQTKVVEAFNGLGASQGAVLTYAPYVGILLSDGPAGSPY
ncbi:MAG: hypothetical protein ACQETD_00905 [Pseudomonadota bacterium]